MKKIMFSTRYGLEEKVITGKKPMTRRIVKCPRRFKGVDDVELEFHRRLGQDFYYDCVVVDGDGHELGQLPLPYEVGDVVAVLQTYERAGWKPDTLQQAWVKKPTVFPDLDPITPHSGWVDLPLKYHKGWSNKMFVRPELMPWQIVITDLWFEHMQDISEEDCLKEGIEIEEWRGDYRWGFYTGFFIDARKGSQGSRSVWYDSPQRAFGGLIDRVSHGKVWDENPWVVVYAYDLQRAKGFE